jgi:putative two-component system response regulator
MQDAAASHLPVGWPLPGQVPADFRLLVVDDQDIVRVALLRILRRAGYQCLEANDAFSAMELLQHHPVDLVLSDVMMPGMNGLELVKALASRIPDTAILLVTGMDSLDMAMECLSSGAFAYVTKPVHTNGILIAVANALRRRMLELDYRDREAILARKVREQTLEIRSSREEIAMRLISASEHRDSETGAHVRRIGLYAAELGRLLGWDEDRVDLLRCAAPMHDIGKIGVPDRILQKQGSLTAEEWIIMRTHTLMGSAILKDSQVPFIQMGARVAACHHERWNGQGYPLGMSGERIPLEGRIVTLVDIYDALRCRRVYKRSWTESETLAFLQDNAGNHFDPSLVSLFLGHYDLFREILARNPEDYAEEDLA